jgi:hypothetical protein
MNYRVTWVIDIEADSHLEAAREARAIQLDERSDATVYEVIRTEGNGRNTHVIDLTNLTEEVV